MSERKREGDRDGHKKKVPEPPSQLSFFKNLLDGHAHILA